MKWDCNSLRRPPWRGAGAVPRHPPHRVGLGPSLSYTHRPMRRGAHEPSGRGADFSIPQNSFVWASLKMGSRASERAGARTPPRGEFFAARRPGCSCLPPSYTHRPLRRALHEPSGRGADFSIPQNSFVWASLKMGSRASERAGARTPPLRASRPEGCCVHRHLP